MYSLFVLRTLGGAVDLFLFVRTLFYTFYLELATHRGGVGIAGVLWEICLGLNYDCVLRSKIAETVTLAYQGKGGAT